MLLKILLRRASHNKGLLALVENHWSKGRNQLEHLGALWVGLKEESHLGMLAEPAEGLLIWAAEGEGSMGRVKWGDWAHFLHLLFP